jgi:hypothetical protein
VVLRALEKDPERRFQTGAEMAAAIDTCRNASRRLLAFAPEVGARADDRTARPQRRSSATFLAVAAALAASGAAAIVYTALR